MIAIAYTFERRIKVQRFLDQLGPILRQVVENTNKPVTEDEWMEAGRHIMIGLRRDDGLETHHSLKPGVFIGFVAFCSACGHEFGRLKPIDPETLSPLQVRIPVHNVWAVECEGSRDFAPARGRQR